MALTALRIIWQLLRPYPWILPVMAALGMGASFAEGIGIGFFIPLVDVLIPGSKGSSPFGVMRPLIAFLQPYSHSTQLLLIGALITAFFLVKAGLMFLTVSVSASITGRVNDEMRRTVYSKMLDVDYGFFVRSEQGRIVSAFETQIWRTMEALREFFASIAQICTIVVFCILLVIISWQLTVVIVIASIGASVFIGRPMVRHVHQLGNSAVAATAGLTQRVMNSLHGMRVIRAFGQEQRERDRFGHLSLSARSIFYRIDRLTRMIPAVLEAAFAPVFVGTILLAQYLVIDAPVLFAFLILFYRIQPQLKNFDQQRAQIASFAGAMTELGDLIGAEASRHTGSLKYSHLKRSIVF